VMRNAAGLSWLDKNTLLYSRFLTGIHMEAWLAMRAGDFAGGLCSTLRAGHGALLVCVARSSLGSDCGDERARRLGTMPAGSMDGKTPPKDVGPKGSCTSRVVAGWRLDVLCRGGGWAQPSLAAEISGRNEPVITPVPVKSRVSPWILAGVR